MEIASPRLQKGKNDSEGDTWVASSGKKRKRQAEGDVGEHNEARGWCRRTVGLI